MSKSQYEILLEELNKVLCFVSEKEIRQTLPQIELFLCESNVFGDYEEIDEPDERHPVEILRGQLIHIDDDRELAKWYAILALYLAKEIENRKKQNDLKIVNYALHAINVSKSHFVEAEAQKEQLERGIKQHQSKIGTKANIKGYEPLYRFKNEAFARYESAIEELQRRQNNQKTTTKDNRVTYENVAEILYPQIAHLNKDKNNKKLIGRNGDPIGSLARILEEAAQAGDLTPTRGR